MQEGLPWLLWAVKISNFLFLPKTMQYTIRQYSVLLILLYYIMLSMILKCGLIALVVRSTEMSHQAGQRRRQRVVILCCDHHVTIGRLDGVSPKLPSSSPLPPVALQSRVSLVPTPQKMGKRVSAFPRKALLGSRVASHPSWGLCQPYRRSV